MPGPIVDTHVHYWEPERPDRPYDARGMRVGAPVSVESLLATLDATGVDKIIQVTPSIMGDDNRYALEGALEHPHRIRVFGRFDPAKPDLFGRLREMMGQPYLIGLRFTIFGRESSPLIDGTMEAFWREAEELDIPVAIYAADQPKEIGDVARRHPGLRLIVDHFTLHFRQGHSSFEHWPDVLALTDVPIVFFKASYLPEATSEEYPYPKAQQYLREAYERIGPDRLMFGSNYPPSLRVGSYQQAVDFVREACDFLPATDRDKILGGTAIRVLRLPW